MTTLRVCPTGRTPTPSSSAAFPIIAKVRQAQITSVHAQAFTSIPNAMPRSTNIAPIRILNAFHHRRGERSGARLGAVPARTTGAVSRSAASLAKTSTLEAHETRCSMRVATHPICPRTRDITHRKRTRPSSHLACLWCGEHHVILITAHRLIILLATARVRL